ncbi:MAG: hypothetical protein JWL96_2333 [Sphingomonas bacterium]|uniref:right-handed parallel beta-helix repeat-containing protein n=1 Tax=Sphingomonas bacterium TaxID=1895847 RepID=UPI002621262B|nr:right-handed parallel beta-helix repeat-containing protein [Sphingomonas bacterium]MDB5710263.1 hypothetical protein [Sphingomonas bacterium]
MTMRHMRKKLLFVAVLLGTTSIAAPATADTVVATGKAHIDMATASGPLPVANSRSAGSIEQITIVFVGADGVAVPDLPLSVKTSSNALLTVTPTAQPGIYTLAAPSNTTGGNATLIATVMLNGATYMGGRNFAITAAAAGPAPAPTPTPTPAPSASGVSTMIRAATPTLAADQSGCAAVNYYDVGPGKAFAALGQLPWSKLKGCDTVRIYPKAGNAPYNEMILVSGGTDVAPAAPNRFLRVLGMPDPVSGALPIIDGTNATQVETLPGQAPRSLQYHDNGNNRALHRLGIVMVGPQLGYGYNNGPAGYIAIENLDIRNARYDQPFTDGLTGAADKYGSFATCLYVEAAAHFVVKGNILHDCSNGLFINSKNGGLQELSQDVLIENNRFYNNSNPPIAGVTNGYHEHHSYTEARDIIYQYNYFGDNIPGAFGDCIKDRSSGLIIRYNTLASNCSTRFNLEDSTGGGALISGDAGYATTYVYGNVIDVAATSTNNYLAYYGGDSGQTSTYRQGVLYFYNNTMVVAGDGNSPYPDTLLFFLTQPNAVAEVWNNVFYAAPVTPGHQGKAMAMAYAGSGTVNLVRNWMSPSVAATWLGHPAPAKVTGWAANIISAGSPLFQNQSQHLYAPAPGSPLIDAGTSLASLKPGMTPLWLPATQTPALHVARTSDGQIDIGAYEY